jgi:hypothetical protein
VIKRGSNVQIEKKDGYSVFGTYKGSDDEFHYIKGTVGDLIGKLIAVPKGNVSQIVAISGPVEDNWAGTSYEED